MAELMQKDKEDLEAIPWNSQIMPMTPYGVPLLISTLSHAPDRMLGAGKLLF